MEMSTGFTFLFLILIASTVLVNGQLQTGFISIDCGSPTNLNYIDIDTGISYASDQGYIASGINRNISSEYAYPNNPTLAIPLSDLRSFPQGNKNCYTLIPASGKGSLNLIRATFLYGNYDGENKLPEFDIYLGVNLWSSVKFRNASDVVTIEIISTALSDATHICLVNKGLGTPFISALEFRPLNSSIYNTEFGASASLVLFERLDVGLPNGTGRYKDDVFDPIWSSYNSPSWDMVSTSIDINRNDNGYIAPQEVIQSAVTPRNATEPLELYWTTDDANSEFYIYMYFAEVEELKRNQSRKFDVSWNGSPMFTDIIPRYLYADTISNSRALVGKEHQISIYRTGSSSLPPVLNAAEIFIVKQLDELPTFTEDVDAVMNIRTTYQLNKPWVGDPCGPKNYTWEDIKCVYNGSVPPRIVSLNLTSSGLRGIIAASIAKLSAMESLDLSNNSLTGLVPEFLQELRFLKFLNLKGNQLSGNVPSSLVEKSKAGLLTLSVDEKNLCRLGSCKKNNKATIAIVVLVSAILVLAFVLIIIWILRRKRKTEVIAKKKGSSVETKKQQFTYAETVSITDNFKTVIGKGGFGTVYHGRMVDGTQVAVKTLSPSSAQGPKEFQTEAELLMRVHHRNLASFIGYCDDDNKMALIYEYMANGNLKNCLADKSSNALSWGRRLSIAIDAAQGLEYLHHGCKPPIVHRDVKSANILLSETLEAKIADFGLSKALSDTHSHVLTTVMGTTGYLDPEYYISRKLTDKSDVYSFGVVLLELITGKPAIIKGDERIHIIDLVSPELEKWDLTQIVDERLHGDFDVNSVWKAVEIAMSCTTTSSSQRASMGFVLAELKQCLAMELSRNRERSSESRTEVYIKSYNTSEVHSMDSESITAPSARW